MRLFFIELNFLGKGKEKKNKFQFPAMDVSHTPYCNTHSTARLTNHTTDVFTG
jgi:hypothetical protein